LTKESEDIMPCYTSTTVQTDVSKWNATRAQAAIAEARKALSNMSFGATIYNGKLTVTASSEGAIATIQKTITQKYAALTVKEASRRFGWTVKAQTTTQTGLTQIKLGRA